MPLPSSREDLPGKPDVVLPGRKAVVFAHGCFWHQHEGCPNVARPTPDVEFWTKKLDRNVARDAENFKALRESGWRVFVAWECDIGTDGFGAALLAFLADQA